MIYYSLKLYSVFFFRGSRTVTFWSTHNIQVALNLIGQTPVWFNFQHIPMAVYFGFRAWKQSEKLALGCINVKFSTQNPKSAFKCVYIDFSSEVVTWMLVAEAVANY